MSFPVSPRERALLSLIEGQSFDRAMPSFLAELAELVPFDWAAFLSSRAREGARASVWRSNGGGSAFEEADGASAGLLTITDPGNVGVSEISDPLLLQQVRSQGVGSSLQVGLSAGEHVSAMLLLGRWNEDPFDSLQLEAAEPLWQPLASAFLRGLDEERAARASRERAAELSTLFEIVRTAGRALDFDELFFGLASALQPLACLDAVAVLLEQEGRGSVTIFLARPLQRPLEKLLVERCIDRFRKESARDGHPFEVRERPLPGFDPEEASAGGKPRLFDAVPLYRRDEVVGIVAIVAEHQEPKESMARMLAAAAGQASLTVDRLLSGAESQAMRLRALIDSMSDGVILTDRRMNVEMLNTAAREHLRFLIASTDAGGPAVLDDLGGARLSELAAGVLAGREASVSAEVSISSLRRIFRLTLTPMTGGRGEVSGLVVVTSDITEARALQEQMIQTEKLSALGEMISGVAHELNNPLASVMGYSQLLRSARVRPEVRRRLETIASEAGRCQSIVRNLLSFARKHSPERRPLSVNEVVQSVLALMTYHLRADGVGVETSFDDSLPPVCGDFHQLQQVFLNVITNAYQALKHSFGRKSLAVRTRLVDGWVRVEIEDSGPGITAENLGKVFDPFFTTKEVGQGTGLGLSIAFGTIKAHEGRIGVRSIAGSGATFTVDLPAAASVPIDPVVMDAEPLPRGIPSRHILVVEDEQAISSLLRETLAAEGHKVDTATDGWEARRKLARREYDVIITDLKMPREGGRELYEEMVSTRPEIARRFIFATGDMISTEARDFFERVGRPVLGKPFDVGDLRRLVRETIRDN